MGKSEEVYITSLLSSSIFSKREGYDVDLERVMYKAGEHDRVLELNTYYDRLDLGELQLRRAKERGIKISIGTDAHNVGELRLLLEQRQALQ